MKKTTELSLFFLIRHPSVVMRCRTRPLRLTTNASVNIVAQCPYAGVGSSTGGRCHSRLVITTLRLDNHRRIARSRRTPATAYLDQRHADGRAYDFDIESGACGGKTGGSRARRARWRGAVVWSRNPTQLGRPPFRCRVRTQAHPDLSLKFAIGAPPAVGGLLLCLMIAKRVCVVVMVGGGGTGDGGSLP